MTCLLGLQFAPVAQAHEGDELLDIDACDGEYGVAVACFNWGTGRQKIRRHKIQLSESGRPFIRKEGIRFYFSDTGHGNVILRA